MLRKLAPNRWVNSILRLRHARVHLRNHCTSFFVAVISAASSRNSLDVAVGCTDYLVAIFMVSLFRLSPDGFSEVVHVAAVAARAFDSSDGGV